MREQRFYAVWDLNTLDDRAIQADFMEIDKVIFDTALGERHRHVDYNLAFYFLVIEMDSKKAIEQIKRFIIKWYTDRELFRLCNGDVTTLKLQQGRYMLGRKTLITEGDLWKRVNRAIEVARMAKRV